ncbi:MAG TPA: ABC transporter ATP-binding protein [Armatimonadota bacterium]|nr:ABC transporter ATP-binding protein [Armatimonadota bacterium]
MPADAGIKKIWVTPSTPDDGGTVPGPLAPDNGGTVCGPLTPDNGGTVPGPAIEIRNLRFRYRQSPDRALDDISFAVYPGEIALIAGPSGCGKTTLLRCLNGLIPRSYRNGELEGQILIEGEDPSPLSLSEISRRVGTVLQNPDKQIVGSCVANELAFGLENRGVPRPEMRRQVTDLLNEMELGPLAGRTTFELSGGEKQKVTIAGALILEPNILLLDEPLSNLDPAAGDEAMRLIRLLADAGKAVLLIEHRVEDALAIRPDRALLLQEGRQVYWGDLAGFLEHADPRQLKLPAENGTEDGGRRTEEGGRRTEERARGVRPETRGAFNRSACDSSSIVHPSSSVLGPPSVLAFRGVSFRYERAGEPALSEVSLEVAPGDVVAILGANGAGKSTLLKMGIGLIRPQEGAVLLKGADTAQMTTAAMTRSVGYVFQDPARMFFAATVREELAFGPRNLGYPEERIHRAVDAAIGALDLTALQDRSPLSLSFGQQKRTSIAAVVAMESRILLLDEPTAGQDYAHTIQFMDAILKLPHFEAIVFITHDVDLAVQYANRVALLRDGRIRLQGTPQETLTNPEILAECHLRMTSRLRALRPPSQIQ